MDGDHIRLTGSCQSGRTREMLFGRNALEGHPESAGVLRSSLVSLITIAIHTAGLIIRTNNYVLAVDAISFVVGLSWEVTGSNVNQ